MSSSSNSKRVLKISEFIAHSSNISSCTIGRKSNVAATGGEDKKLNLWTFNKPTCIMTLNGHTSTITTITFSANEDKIVSGCSTGSMKIWDLDANKLICNLVGHKSDVSCLEYHGYADYIASGSADSQIRLWDLRRKGCIFTYKGHTNRVNSLRFSPDSKWIASASDDGLVKIWDLKAGRLLSDLKGHTAAIKTLEFHPNEFLLATGSADRTVKFWDLEKMESVSTSPLLMSSVNVILFEQNGRCLFAGCNDYLFSLSWEPSECYDSVSCQWKQVSDLKNYSNKLLATSFSQNILSFYAVDLSQVAPIGTPPQPQTPTPKDMKAAAAALAKNVQQLQQQKMMLSTSSSRKNFLHQEKIEPTEQLDDEVSHLQHLQNQNDLMQQNAQQSSNVANIIDQDAYNKIFRQAKKLNDPANLEPAEAPATNNNDNNQLMSPKGENNNNNKMRDLKIQGGEKPSRIVAAQRSEEVVDSKFPKVEIILPKSSTENNIRDSMQQPQSPSHQQMLKSPKSIDDHLSHFNMKDFLNDEDDYKSSANELAAFIENGHEIFLKAVKNRHKNMQVIRSLWTGGNIKSALDTAVSLDDVSLIADILNQLNQTTGVWNLDICTILLPSIRNLIGSKYEEHTLIGTESCKIIFKNFGKLIKTSIQIPGIGVDICAEERRRKCNSCYSYFLDIISIIEKKLPSATSSKIINNFKEINLLMKTIE